MYTPFDLSANPKKILPFLLFHYLPWDFKAQSLKSALAHSLHPDFTPSSFPAFSVPTASIAEYSLSGNGPHEPTQGIREDVYFTYPMS